jgi:hypothetical protein
MNGWLAEWMNEFCDPAATSALSIDFGFLATLLLDHVDSCLSEVFKGHPVERTQE